MLPRPPVLGPALPPGFRRAAYEDDDDDNKEEEDFPGPALPPGYQADSSSSEAEDDVIGPMPHKGPVEDSTALDFERRARKMKDKLTGDVSPPLSFICVVYTPKQRWEVVEYKYFVTVLKYIFLVSVLYSTTCFSDDFLLLLLTFLTQIPVLSTSYIFKTGSLL